MFVTGLDESVTNEDLYDLFSKYGEIKSAKISVDTQTSKSIGHGYVWFMNEESSMQAIRDSQNF